MIRVLIPTINMEKAERVAELMVHRAGIDCEVIVEEDTERIGWVAMINKMVRDYPADYYVYAADDAYPSRHFLKRAFDYMQEKEVGLVAFNEGKFQDQSAGFALVDKKWISKIYGDDLLYPGYKSHYADVEIAFIAKAQNEYGYDPRACLIEIVWNKDGPDPLSNNKEDTKLFFDRAEEGFGGFTKKIPKLN